MSCDPPTKKPRLGVDAPSESPNLEGDEASVAAAPIHLSVVCERGLRGCKLSRWSWPRAEVAVSIDTRTISVLPNRRDILELLLEDCTLHHSRLSSGFLGVRFMRQDCQLLLSGAPEILRRLFKEVLAATHGFRKRLAGLATERYKYLTGVQTKRRRRSFLRGDAPCPSREASAEKKPATPNGCTEDAGGNILTEQQRTICQAAVNGESFFFTGGAGTGKSFLLQHLLRRLNPETTAVTAATALAASHLGGTTLHRWAGVGRGEGDVLVLATELRKRKGAMQRWRRTKTLVIDEVSMVDGHFFDKLEALARGARACDLPFGGLQVVLAGDFMQLPPIGRTAAESDQSGSMSKHWGGQTFCFEVPAWKAIRRTFELTEVFRQKEDKEFCNVLNEVRFGQLSEVSRSLLLTRLVAGTCSHNDASSVTRLMPLRSEVERVNTRALSNLSGELVVFEARDQGNPDELDSLSGARRIVELRVGALVILTRHVDVRKKLVNGSQGRVVAFAGSGSLRHPVVAFSDAGVVKPVMPEAFEARCAQRVIGVRVQLPLELAWAISIHKSQGMTLNTVEVSLDTVFEHGQAYVAMSRARSLAGLSLIGNEQSLKYNIHADPKCLEFYKRLGSSVPQGGCECTAESPNMNESMH